jgi:hypothetical protein
MMDKEPMIPKQEEGGSSNTESEQHLSSEEKAKEFYEVVRARLLHVNRWQDHAGPASASFQLLDKTGKEADRIVQAGDYFQITVPGPGPVAGDGKDFVQVEAISDTENEVAIKVRPAPSPLNNQEDVAHFFKEEATSSFVVKREGSKVIAGSIWPE